LVLSFSSCKNDVDGCTDPAATNFNSSATNDDGSCLYATNNNNPPSYSNFCNYYVDGIGKISQGFFTMIYSGSHQFQAYQSAVGTFPDMAFILNKKNLLPKARDFFLFLKINT